MPTRTSARDDHRLRDKFRGAMLGTAVGDALGAPFEGRPMVEPARLRRWARHPDPLRWTDDTHMAIGVAESLLEVGGFDGERMARHLASRYHAEPWRGYGAGPPQVFTALAQGTPWDQAAGALFDGQGSHGNGAAMRVAPVALLAYPDHAHTETLARETARVTHTHELGQQGAALQACALAWLLDTTPPASTHTTAEGFASALVAAVRPAAPSPEFRQRLEWLAADATTWPPQQAAAMLGNGIAAVQAVPAALWALLGHPDSFADAVGAAVSLGGDTDTIAAMTGALAGALLGASAIPPAWLERLEAAEHLTALADRLLDLHP